MFTVFKHLLVFFSFFFLLQGKVISEERYCIDNQGLVLPLFDQSDCANNDDMKINQDEFEYIIKYDSSERIKKLEYYKNNKDEIRKAKKENILKDNDELKKNEEKEKIKIAEEQKRKNLDIKKKIEAKKAERQAKIEKRKKDLEKKKLLRKAEQEKKKKERIARIEKKKKDLEKKKLERKAEQDKKKAERKAKIEKKQKLNKIKKELAEKNKKNKKLNIKQAEKVNNNLKIIYFDKTIVKKESFPNINPDSNFDFETSKDFNLNKTNNLLAGNSNLLIIIPKDFDTLSNVSSEENLTSQMIAGTRSVPNPEFNRLQAEMRRTERELQRALAEAERGFRMSQCISCGLITQWGGIALQDKWQEEGKKLQNRLNRLITSYSSTPDYLDKELLRSYTYVVQNIEAEKNAIFQIIQFKNNKLFEKNISVESKKNFKVAYNIDPQDKKYENLISKYSTSDQVASWQNQKLKNISLGKLISLIDSNSDSREILDTKELYASLNFASEDVEDELSWWEKLLSGSKKNNNKKTASLSGSSSNYEEKDIRFDSVVIVKTENGLGSGFFISDDEILTNYHVIENATSISVTDKFKKRSSAVVIKKDLKRDLALLKTNTTGKPVRFFEGKLKQGEMVEALGHPKGRKFSLTKGWISAIRKESSVYSATGTPDVLFIQTDAAINPGNSGGPLFYKDQVIGVNTQGLHKDVSEGMNFAVHFSEVMQFLSK